MIATNSAMETQTGRRFLLGALGEGAEEIIIDPGEDSGESTAILQAHREVGPKACKGAVDRWYRRFSRRR